MVVEEAVLVSEAGVTPLILPAVEELNNDTPAVELGEMKTTTPESGGSSICLAGRRWGDGH